MLSISIHVNTSPLAGKEGTKINATALKDRIQKEAENDVALKAIFNEKGKNDSSIEVQGRGDLHLGILIEKMRREGYEMAVTPPAVVMKKTASGQIMEPIEEVNIELGLEFVSNVIEKLQNRKGLLINCVELNKEKQKYFYFYTKYSF